MTPLNWESAILIYGPLGLFALAVWRIVNYLGHRFFDPLETDGSGGGYVTRAFEDHRQFMAQLSEKLDRQQELCALHTEHLGDHAANDRQRHLKGRRVLALACDICDEVVAKALPDIAGDVHKSTDQIRSMISE